MARPKKSEKKTRRGNGDGTIYQRKDGTWCAQLTTGVDPLTGKAIRKTIYGKKREDVRDKLTEIQNQKRTNTYTDPGKLTVGEWLDTWLEEYMKNSLRRTTFESYRVQIDRHLKPAIGHIKLKDLETDHLQKLYNAKMVRGRADKRKNEKGEVVTREGGLSARTIRYIHQVIHGALHYARSERKPPLLTINVADGVKLPRDPKKEMKTLSREGVLTFLKHAQKYRYFAAYFTELATGLRRGELLAPRWKDVHISEVMVAGNKQYQGSIKITRHLVRVKGGYAFQEPKTELSRRTVHLSHEACQVLLAHKAKQQLEVMKAGELYENRNNEKERLVFATEVGKHLDPKNFVRDFKGCLKKAGLENIRFHDLRHTYATMALESGATLNAVQEALGHHSPTFTAEQYGHVSQKMKQEVANIMGAFLKDAVQ